MLWLEVASDTGASIFNFRHPFGTGIDWNLNASCILFFKDGHVEPVKLVGRFVTVATSIGQTKGALLLTVIYRVEYPALSAVLHAGGIAVQNLAGESFFTHSTENGLLDRVEVDKAVFGCGSRGIGCENGTGGPIRFLFLLLRLD